MSNGASSRGSNKEEVRGAGNRASLLEMQRVRTATQ